jgi:hypothetical protein
MTIRNTEKKRTGNRLSRTLLSYLRRKTTRQARSRIQIDESGSNWLGRRNAPVQQLWADRREIPPREPLMYLRASILTIKFKSNV